MLSKAHAQEKSENRQVLLTILSNLIFLARQACAIRGDGNENDSNFIQLFKLRDEDNPIVYEWMLKCTDKYISHDMQNDMLKAMAHKVLRNINSRLHNVSHTTNASNKERVVVIFTYVDKNDFSLQEEFLGLYCVPSIDQTH